MKMKIKPNEYAKILFEITKDKEESEVPGILKGFISLVARNNDLKKADEIIKHYSEIYNNEHGIAEVELKSARQLSQVSQKAIEKYVYELTGAENVIINSEVDKKVLGGFILKYGSTIIDASLKNRLDKLKGQMAK